MENLRNPKCSMVDFSWYGPSFKRRSKAAAGIGPMLMSLAKRAFDERPPKQGWQQRPAGVVTNKSQDPDLPNRGGEADSGPCATHCCSGGGDASSSKTRGKEPSI